MSRSIHGREVLGYIELVLALSYIIIT